MVDSAAQGGARDRPGRRAWLATPPRVGYHVQKATGVKLDVVEEGREPAGLARVYLGPTAAAAQSGIDAAKLAPDSFVLRSVGGSLVIVGRDGDGNPLSPDTWAGTLFGVYEMLGEFLGVRWLWPGELGEYVPRVERLIIPASIAPCPRAC